LVGGGEGFDSCRQAEVEAFVFLLLRSRTREKHYTRVFS
jgi:hypothetical protein